MKIARAKRKNNNSHKKCVARDGLAFRVGVLHNNNVRQVGKVVLVVNKRKKFVSFFFFVRTYAKILKVSLFMSTTSFARRIRKNV